MTLHPSLVFCTHGGGAAEWAQLKLRKARLAGQDTPSLALHFPSPPATPSYAVPITFLALLPAGSVAATTATCLQLSLLLAHPQTSKKTSYSRVIALSVCLALFCSGSLSTAPRPAAVLQMEEEQVNLGLVTGWIMGEGHADMHASPSPSNIRHGPLALPGDAHMHNLKECEALASCMQATL